MKANIPRIKAMLCHANPFNQIYKSFPNQNCRTNRTTTAESAKSRQINYHNNDREKYHDTPVAS